MTSPAELADRVEGLEGPCRDTDLAICIALDTGRSTDPRNLGAPHYTASLDAVKTLVPDGHGWKVRKWAGGGAAAGCYASGGADNWHNAATPALALCAAALRAMKP